MINKYIIISLLSFFYILGFAPYNIFFLGIIAIIGLSFIFIRINNKKDLIISSLLSSFTISSFGMYWLIYSSTYTFKNILWGVPVLIGFSLLYSVFIFMISLPIYLLKKHKTLYYFILVIAWSTADAFKFYFLGGFPWFLSAYLWGFSLPIIQIVSIIGVMGLSIFSYALIFSVFILFDRSFSKYFRYNLFSILIMSFIGFYFYGQARINDLDSLPVEKTLNVRLVQPNIAQEEKMNLDNLDNLFKETILQSIEKTPHAIPSLIFLPETSFFFSNEKSFEEIFNRIPKNSFLITGALRFDSNNLIYNSVFSLSNHKIYDYYDKIRLVPFGEKIPLSKYFPNLFNFVGLSTLTSGNTFKVFTVKNYKFIPTICFEGLFPLENITAKDIDFILNFANEGWFNKAIELEQSWDIYKYRSIETGVMSIKVANTGISGAYDFKGEVLLKVNPFKKINTDISLPIKKSKTIFSEMNYHMINYILFIFYGVMILFIFLRKKST